MIQICSELITVPSKTIFEQSLKEKKNSEIWRKINVVPIHRKEKQKPN